jgi:hypothetical protein
MPPLRRPLSDCTPHRGSRVAANVRRWRARQRAGLIVLKVPALEYDLVQAMIESERLTPAAALDRRKVEQAAASILMEWAERWAENP